MTESCEFEDVVWQGEEGTFTFDSGHRLEFVRDQHESGIFYVSAWQADAKNVSVVIRGDANLMRELLYFAADLIEPL